jgi:streptogramin lyase
MMRPGTMLAAMLVMLTAGATAHAKMEMRTFPVLAGAGAHGVYPAPDGAVWFTAQSAGKLGRLDPRTGKSDLIALGPGAAPHGVIVGPDGAAWVTEGGQNAIARGWIPRPAPSQQKFVNRKNPHQVCVHFGAHFCSAPRALVCLLLASWSSRKGR